jgi:short-subunit dehydrogenase
MLNKYVLITGASGGLGREYTNQLLAQGFNLILVARNKERLDYFKDSLIINDKQIVLSFQCDVMKNEDVISLFNFIGNKGIKLHKIIHIAGLEVEGWFKETTHEDIIKIAQVNVVGSTNIIHRALDHKDDSLEILLMSSLAGYFPMPMKAVYAASKRYLIDLTRTLNYELNDDNIYITAVCPAGMATKMEIIKKIRSQGFMGNLTTVDVNIVVRKSLQKLEKHKTIYIPGKMNVFIMLVSKLIPRKRLTKTLGKRWKRTL